MKIKNVTRTENDSLGRFGGGWQYEIGVTANRKLNCFIVSLLFWQIRISFKEK